MSITLERLTKETVYIAVEMLNSNPSYTRAEYGKETVSNEEIAQAFLHGDTKCFLIKLDDTYIGMTDYLEDHEEHGHLWIGSFLIHRDYQGYSFGAQAYEILEGIIKERGVQTIRLFVLEENERGVRFFENRSFTRYEKAKSRKNQDVYCLEKVLG